MHLPSIHLFRSSFLAVFLFTLLVACGAPAAQTPATPPESPEDRVKSFFATFSQALSDPEISTEAKRNEWIDTLTNYATPDNKEDARTAITNTLDEFGSFDIATLTGQTGLDVRMEITFAITETRLAEENGDRAKVELLDGVISMRPVGSDVEELGEMAAMLTQEVPLSEFFGDAGNESRFVDLQQIDGVWYMLDVLE